MSSSRITYEELIAYAAGELPPDAQARVAAHVQNDPDAARTVALFRRVVDVARADDSVAPPPATMQAAQALFREQQARRQTNWLANLKRLVADLVADTRLQTARVGLRGGPATYQLSYESDLADVDLEIERPPTPTQPWRLRGHVSPHGVQRAEAVALTACGTFEPLTLAEPDEHGTFALTTASGRFDVFVSLREAVLVLPAVEVE